MSYNYRQNIEEELKPEEISLNFKQLLTKYFVEDTQEKEI